MEDREVKEMHHLLTTTLDCSKSRLRLNVLTWFPEQATTLTKHWKAHYFVHQPCHMGMACSRVKQANTKIVFPPHHSTIGGIFSLALSSKTMQSCVQVNLLSRLQSWASTFTCTKASKRVGGMSCAMAGRLIDPLTVVCSGLFLMCLLLPII